MRHWFWRLLWVGVFATGSWAQALSPDLSALQGLVRELETRKPPLDPTDEAAIRDDAVAAMANIGTSTVPYRGIPEALYGARLGQRVANLFYHRFGAPDAATTVISQVQATYAAIGPTASLIATSLGSQASAAAALPSDFSPGSNATSEAGTWSCEDPPSAVEVEALLIGAHNQYAATHPGWTPTGGSYRSCQAEPGTSGDTIFLQFILSGTDPGPPPKSMQLTVFAIGSNLNTVTFSFGL